LSFDYILTLFEQTNTQNGGPVGWTRISEAGISWDWFTGHNEDLETVWCGAKNCFITVLPWTCHQCRFNCRNCLVVLFQNKREWAPADTVKRATKRNGVEGGGSWVQAHPQKFW